MKPKWIEEETVESAEKTRLLERRNELQELRRSSHTIVEEAYLVNSLHQVARELHKLECID